MSQKMKLKDVIFIAIFSVLFFAVMLVAVAVLGSTPVTLCVRWLLSLLSALVLHGRQLSDCSSVVFLLKSSVRLVNTQTSCGT